MTAGESYRNVTVEKVVQGGRGLCRTDEGILFVEQGLPGERLAVATHTRHRGYQEAGIVDILSPSPLRRSAECRYYGLCGGCDFQHITYEGQLELKLEILRENLLRIAKFPPEHAVYETLSIQPGPAWGYRCRARFQSDVAAGSVGFFGRASNRVVSVDHCPVLTPVLDTALSDREAIHDILPKRKRGRSQRESGIFALANESAYALEGERIGMNLLGRDFVTEARLFFQANRSLFETMLSEYILPEAGERAVDLYSGIGVIAAFLAESFSQVTAVETQAGCRSYAEAHLPGHARHYCGSVESWRPESTGGIDLLVVDPPRTGLSGKACRGILELLPERIVYISCNPVTFSRDAALLNFTGGYHLQTVTAYDFYPQTTHMELAARFQRPAS